MLGDTLPYTPPSWLPSAEDFLIPTHRIKLASTPTPLQRVSLPGLPESFPQIIFKRDDCTGGIEMSGNKVRKLEFLLAEAQSRKCNHVLTAGGTQSNHVRATVAAARVIGLPTTCLIRDDFASESGNFFLNKLMGADVRFLKRDLYLEKGGWNYFFETTLEELSKEQNKNPYFIPVGGTCPLGNFGYLECAREIFDPTQLSLIEGEAQEEQQDGLMRNAPVKLTNIVTTAGSGSTLVGLALGATFWQQQQQTRNIEVTGYAVCDSPEYFYDMGQQLYSGMLKTKNGGKQPGERCSNGVVLPPLDSTAWMECRNAKGLGYSKATDEELQFLNRVARESGIVLDRSYTNKAVMQLVNDLVSGSLKPEGQLMFVHTGGGSSSFDRYENILKCEGWRD